MLFTTLNDLWALCMDFFTTVFHLAFTPIWELLENNSNSFTDLLLSIASFAGIEAFLSSFSLAGFIFAFGTLIAIVVYFFIP